MASPVAIPPPTTPPIAANTDVIPVVPSPVTVPAAATVPTEPDLRVLLRKPIPINFNPVDVHPELTHFRG